MEGFAQVKLNSSGNQDFPTVNETNPNTPNSTGASGGSDVLVVDDGGLGGGGGFDQDPGSNPSRDLNNSSTLVSNSNQPDEYSKEISNAIKMDDVSGENDTSVCGAETEGGAKRFARRTQMII